MRRPGRILLCCTAVLGAIAATLARIPADNSDYVLLLIKALLHATSLRQDLMLQAAMASMYTRGAWYLARICLLPIALLHFPPDRTVEALNLFLWGVQAALMFRLARDVTRSRWAGLIAALWFGVGVPFCLSDAPYSLQKLERSIGLIPLLWALVCLLRERRWLAWMGLAAATYLHANPAVYLWPVFITEESLLAWRDPKNRRGVLGRCMAAVLIAIPLVAGFGGKTLSPDPDHERLGILIHASWIGGWFDRGTLFFDLEGAALVFMAVWRWRRLPAAPIFLRSLFLCLAMISVGTLVYSHQSPGSPIWSMVVRIQPWVGLYLFNLAGLIFLAAWVASGLRRGNPLWPAFLFCLLEFSGAHDCPLRLVGVGLGACMLARRIKLGLALVLATVAGSFAYQWMPDRVQAAARALGLHGGFFASLLFSPRGGAALLLCAAAGVWLSRTGRRPGSAVRALSWAFCGGLLFWSAGSRTRFRTAGATAESSRMALADWARNNTPPSAVLIPSPIDLIDDTGAFMSRAERSMFVNGGYGETAINFGALGVPMGRRLGAMGIDLGKVRKLEDYRVEVMRADDDLNVAHARRLAAEAVGPAYLLLRAGRHWPYAPLYRDDAVAVYKIPSP